MEASIKHNVITKLDTLRTAKTQLIDIVDKHTEFPWSIRHAISHEIRLQESSPEQGVDESNQDYDRRMRETLRRLDSSVRLMMCIIEIIRRYELNTLESGKTRVKVTTPAYREYTYIVPGSKAQDVVNELAIRLLGEEFGVDDKYTQDQLNTLLSDAIQRKFSPRNFIVRFGLWLINHF